MKCKSTITIVSHATLKTYFYTTPVRAFTVTRFWITILLLILPLSTVIAQAAITIGNYPAAAKNLKDTNINTVINYPPLTEREGKGMQLPLPPSVHPRLFLTANEIPLLKEKISHPLLQGKWNKIEKGAASSTDGYLPINGTANNNSIIVRDAIEAKALLFLMNKNEKSGRDAVESALHYFATLKMDSKLQDISREMGRAIVTGAMVYDWCYLLLTNDEKNMLIARMETLATQMEIGWPQIKGSSITGHTVEAQLARDMLSLAIATYNEKPVIYNRVAGRIFAEFLPARQFFYPAGYHHQGSAYGAYRFYWDMFTTFIFDKMGYPNIYGITQQNIPYYFIYSRRPDGQLMRNGDDYNEQYVPFGHWWGLGQGALLLAGSYHKDAITLNEALKERKPGETADYIFDFLFFDTKVYQQASSKTVLPLTAWFKEPFGAMIARTGWEDGIPSADVIAMMKVQAYNFSNHQHLDAGSFQLYYKGPLAVQSGIYQGKNGAYGGEHFKNYSQRSMAHNTMLVYDSSEKFTWLGRTVINDGGQPFPNDGREPENMAELLAEGYKTGTVLAHAFGPDSMKPEFSYLKGELAEAYLKKVKSFKRSFVFLNLHDKKTPAALIVFDRVEAADKKFKKTWLLHCVEEPLIEQNNTTITRSEKGYNGQLVNTTLLPEAGNVIIRKIGGRGKEFTVGEQNFPQTIVAANNSWDSAVWRIEVSPEKDALTDNFLHVMQVMDYNKGTTKPLAVEKIETNKLVGSLIGDRMVLFSKNGELLNESFRITISSAGFLKILITDLNNGQWNVRCIDNHKLSPGVIESNGNSIYFKAGKGNYIIQKLVSK